MATNIILKKSSITGRVPNDSALAYGELAINYTDGKLYYKHSSQTVRSFLDENQIISLIDSDYVAARAPAGGEGGGTDSAQVIGIIEDTIDSDYIVARLGTVGSPLVVFNYEADSGQSEFTGTDVNGNALSYQAEDLLVFVNGILLIDSDDYTATNGSSISLFVPADSGDLVTIAAFNIRLSAGLDSADVTTLIDSDYINARVTATAGTDSAQVISLITDTVDSAYIQARQVDVFRDSAFITNIIDSDYIAARSAPGTDSATVVSIVTDTVDSAYVAARSPEVDLTGYATESYVTTQINNLIDGAPDALNTLNELAAALNDDSDAYNSLLSLIGGKLDSAGVTNLIDSDYINARVVAQAGTDSAQVISLITDTVDSAYIAARVYIDSDLILSTLGTGQSPLVTYQFTATNGQVIFDGLDDNGRTLSYTETEDLLIFVNGVLLAADDYTATSGTSLVLDISADSGDTVTISRFNILDAIQNTSPIEMYVYTADSGQTIFSGVDDNSNTLSYQNEKLLVYLNGVLLVDSADYTATSGTSITLTSATAVDDVVSIATFNMARGAGIDSFDVLALIDSDYIAARSSAGTDSATVVSLITDTVDSAYIQARQIDIYRDSAFVTGIIDSDYISARVSAGTDSATVATIVTDTVDSAYVQARQITYDVLDSADVAGIVEAYGYLTTALDSTQAVTLITSTVDSAYIQARQADIYRDSGFITGLIDSAYVAARAPTGTDSSTVISIITGTVDSAYIQARQVDVFRDSSFITNLIDSDYVAARAPTGTDSATVVSIIEDTVDSSYILSTMGVIGSPLVVFTYEADSGQTVFSGQDLQGQTLYYNNEDILVYLNGVLLVDSDDYVAENGSSVTLYTGADSGNILTIASFNIRLSDGLDSADVVAFIDSDYIAARSAPGTDSATVISIITDTVDTPFVVDLIGQAVDSTADVYFNSITIGANAVIQGDLQVSGTTTTVDAANLSITDNMIYLNAGESDGSPTAFIDIGFAGNYNDVGSYAHTGFFRDATDGVWKIFEGYTPEPDSSVQIDTTHASFSLASLAVKDITGQYLGFDSDFGTKVVSDLINDANYLDSTGVINLVDSAYVAARAPAGTDSATVIGLIQDTVDSSYILSTMGVIGSPLALFTYEADSGQTTFSGTDLNGQSLYYNNEDILVYLNGLLLKDSTDYTASNGTSVVLNLAADSGDVLTVASFNIRLSDGLDSADVTTLIDSDYIAARSAPGTDSATVVSIVTDTVDSAYVQARQITYDVLDSANVAAIVESYGYLTTAIDSAQVINLIDSDYINARVTATAGTDSAQVISLITDTVDSSYIGLRIPNTPATISQFKFVATNGQTAFTGADFNGNTLAYNASSVQVYMNGVRLVDSDDYTAINGTSISLTSGATTGDQLVITNASGIGGSVDLSAVSQNIIPFADSAYDLGSPTKKFRSLYLSGNTLYLGSLQLKDSAGELSIVDSDGESVSVGGGYVSTYGLDGTLQVFNGSQRKYIHDAFTLATVDAYLVTGPVGSSVTIRINKNGISIGTITIADGTTKTENTVFGTGFIKGDYITVDITAVGSSTPGTDLYLNFIFS